MPVLLALFAGCGGTVPVVEEPVEQELVSPIRWLTNYQEAVEEARVQHRKVFLFFTGSDWSDYCQEMRNEVLLTPEFADFAAENLILVEIDFPIHKRQAAEMVGQNEILYQDYGIEGFPCIVVLSPDGVEQGRLEETVPAAPADLIEWLKGGPVPLQSAGMP